MDLLLCARNLIVEMVAASSSHVSKTNIQPWIVIEARLSALILMLTAVREWIPAQVLILGGWHSELVRIVTIENWHLQDLFPREGVRSPLSIVRETFVKSCRDGAVPSKSWTGTRNEPKGGTGPYYCGQAPDPGAR